MNKFARLVCVGTLGGCALLQAQNFIGSDDFSSVVAGNWSLTDTTSNGGAFTVVSGALNFTGPSIAGSQSTASRAWVLNIGSSTADWQVQMDFTLSLSQMPAQVSIWDLVLTNSADATTTPDYFQVEFVKSYMQANPFVRGTIYTDGNMGTSNQVDVASNTVAVRAAYLAASQTLTMAYDANGSTGGYVFTDLYSSSVAAWTMGAGDGFVLTLLGTNLANAMATNPVVAGEFTADNFAASPTAPIPEPSTYAAAFGALALLVAGLKRRFGQQ